MNVNILIGFSIISCMGAVKERDSIEDEFFDELTDTGGSDRTEG